MTRDVAYYISCLQKQVGVDSPRQGQSVLLLDKVPLSYIAVLVDLFYL